MMKDLAENLPAKLKFRLAAKLLQVLKLLVPGAAPDLPHRHVAKGYHDRLERRPGARCVTPLLRVVGQALDQIADLSIQVERQHQEK
jgi:hypothetical protein